ncbi:PqqD family peptide modification chaperone [Paraliomyxa miuraensis]|uniref:PqqD family peptide modification chaperone n=1 Tax=Paraliomyxa miuraensis TaxID=376150 RepID=UPI0022533D88|nr:PqqD family peptide modification chaperone [Paraliomyxa miuraensis]MCX4240599.1 methyltransferase [Paraliomyxa miuraensis]
MADALSLSELLEGPIDELRAVLREAAFDDAFLGRCEAIAPRMLDAVRLPAVVWWLRHRTEPAAVLARLWAYGDAVDDHAVARVLDRGLVDWLSRAGALRRSAEGWRGGMRLLPFEELWIASDDMHGADPVMGPGATTQELARAIPHGAGRVLDVGCGAGSLALVAAARGATEVVGVDLHPRAESWARFDAALNGLAIELHTGDLTAPVAGRRFDLVIAQPPFVVHPPQVEATTYLHGGAMGDELTMRLIAELPRVLAPGGQARILFDSPVRPDAPLWRRLQDAHGDDALQQLLFVAPGNSPELQAIGYAANSHPRLGPEYARAVQRYREHLHAQGIERSEHALAVLRHRASSDEQAPPLSVTLERATLAGVSAEVIEQTWQAIATASLPSPRLLRTLVGLPDDAWLVQELAADGSEARLSLRLPAGRGGSEALSDAAAMLVEQLREPATVAELVERYAQACEVQPDEIASGVIEFVRQSLVSGRLVAAGEDE